MCQTTKYICLDNCVTKFLGVSWTFHVSKSTKKQMLTQNRNVSGQSCSVYLRGTVFTERRLAKDQEVKYAQLLRKTVARIV